jgi:hypothetical protein
MIICATVIILIFFIIIFKKVIESKESGQIPLTAYILPFSYQLTDKIMAGCDVLYDFLEKYPNDKVKSRVKDIMNDKCMYRPTWGIKIKRDNPEIEYELYSYNYTPDSRSLNRIDSFSLERLSKLLCLKQYNVENGNYVMFSYDLHSDDNPNFYYVGYSTSEEDYGTSMKNGEIQNKYYRYVPDAISNKWIDYFDKKYLPLDYPKDLKVVFIADKLKRDYIGVYYDGVECGVVKDLLTKIDVNLDFLDKYLSKRFSISVDLCKKTKKIMRIGIYGIMY